MTTSQKSSKKGQTYRNPYEAQSGSGSSIARDIEAQRKAAEAQLAQVEKEESEKSVANPEFSNTVFDLQTHKETIDKPKQIEDIQKLISEIRREVKEIKAKSQGVNAEVEQIEKATLESLPGKLGVYHVHYLEILLSFLQGVKAKVGEAKTWLSAMRSKKAKRGSAFSARKKKKGNEYADSQELSVARNVL